MLSGFPLTYSKSDLTVNFGETNARVKQLLSGNSEQTKVIVIVPSGQPGIVTVTVSHSAGGNPASFDFEYIDDLSAPPSPRGAL